MKFTQLHINNFLTIGAASLKLADKGLVLIQGENEDDSSATSNGVGKSSIPDALCWALYGITARGVTGDAVVNKTAKKNCSVRVIVQDGATEYTIVRFRKDAGHKNALHLFTGTANLSLGTDKETQSLVEKIIGCSYEVFRAAVYSGQEQMPDLPGMTDKQLKVLIEEAAGVERIERAYEIARAKMNDAEREELRLRGVVAAKEGEIASIRSRIDDLEIRVTNWDTHQAAKRADLERLLAEKVGEFHALVTRIKDAKEDQIKVGLDILKVGLNDWNSEQERRRKLESDLRHCESQANKEQIAANRLGDRIKAGKDRVAHAVDAKCHACGKPHTKEEIESILLKEASEMAEDKRILAAALKLRDEYRATAASLRESIAAIDALPKPEETLKKIAEGSAALAAIATDKGTLRNIKATHDDLKKQLEEAKTAINPYRPMLTTEENAAIDAAVEISKRREELEAAVGAREVLADCVKVFGPAGVRAHVLDTVTPFLNERTSDYLSVLSDGNITATWTTLVRNKSGELKEKFTIEVEHAKGGDSFAALSGGEKRKVRLAAMLALQDLVAGRATKPIDLWIGDEIDDALDEAGLERLMTILERRARERGTVLVISHNNLKDWCDQTAIVTKSGGVSKVEGALCEA